MEPGPVTATVPATVAAPGTAMGRGTDSVAHLRGQADREDRAVSHFSLSSDGFREVSGALLEVVSASARWHVHRAD